METFGTPIIIPALYLSSGIAFYTGLQASILAFWKEHTLLYWSLAASSFCAAGFQYATADYYLAGSIVSAASALRWQVSFALGFGPSFFAFVAIYSKQHKISTWFLSLVVACTTLFLINLFSPYSLRFTTMEILPPLRFSWGEILHRFSGAPGIWNWSGRVIAITLFVWTGFRSAVMYRLGNRHSAISLGICSILFTAAIMWGFLIDSGIVNSIYLVGFVYIGIALMMSISLGIEQKRVKQSIQDRDRELSSLFKAAPVAIVLLKDRIILQVNDFMTEMFGYAREELVGKSTQILYMSEEECDRIGRDLYSGIRQFGVATIETRGRHKNGTMLHVLLKGAPFDPNDESAGYVTMVMDITERKRVEEKIRSEYSFRKALEDSIPAGIAAGDLEKRLLYVNPAFCKMVGWTEDKLLGSTAPFVYWPPEESENYIKRLEKCLRNMDQKEAEYIFLRRNGERFPVSILISPLTDGNGKVTGMVSSVYDITERKRAEDALRRAEQSAQSYQQQLIRERDRLSLLLGVNNAVVSNLNLKSLIAAISKCLRTLIPHDFTALVVYESKENLFRILALNAADSRGELREGQVSAMDEISPSSIALVTGKPVMIQEEEIKKLSSGMARTLIAEGIKTFCCVPLLLPYRALGTLNFFSRHDGAFTHEDVTLMTQVASQITIAFENALAFQKIAELKDKLAKEKLYLEDEIRTEYNFEEVIGESPALKRILKQVETVAPTDSTVLIQGETGTGKELIARAIHNLSNRRERTFVKMNCAAIPTGLLESELFGSEKGAFTGAISQKIGRFELAHLGTLFLDEVGDIPLELQSKLLRVLQEQEFERLGSTKTIKVNVRIITATNQDLVQMVANKQFRSDLYYRFNVFPIIVPPLRERPEDIPVLIRYFVQRYALSMNKQIQTIPKETMTALTRCHWPGNIRELKNLIERSVILSNHSTLYVPLGELKESVTADSNKITTLEEAEREHILRNLAETHWIIGGPSGAATRLGMKRTTLLSKMKRLRIFRPT